LSSQKRKSSLITVKNQAENGMWEDSLGKSEFDNLAKGSGTLKGEVGQHLSIDVHFLLVESGQESRIRRSIHAGRSINSRDPELSEYSLTRPPISIGILHSLIDVVLRYSIDLASRSP
jgi:hypothetical protein